MFVARFPIENEDWRRRLADIQRKTSKQTRTAQTRIDVGRSIRSSVVDFPSLSVWTAEVANMKEVVVTEFSGVFGCLYGGPKLPLIFLINYLFSSIYFFKLLGFFYVFSLILLIFSFYFMNKARFVLKIYLTTSPKLP